MPATPVFRLFRVLCAGAVVALAGCSTSGNSFNTTDLRFLEPGYTTLDEASQFLQGAPVNIYRQYDGSAIARWAHTSTVLTDAIYFNQELWLAFDPGGYFQHIVKSHNIPHTNLYQDGERVDSLQAAQPIAPPLVQVSTPAQPAQVEVLAVEAPPVAEAPSVPVVESPFSRTAVSYPLGR